METSRRTLLVRLGIVAAGVSLLGACAGPSAGGSGEPDRGFDLVAAFSGERVSKGTVTTALVSTTPFTATLSGRETGSGERSSRCLRLRERFAFPDGSPLQVWRLCEAGSRRYEGAVSTELESGEMAPAVPVVGRRDRDGVHLRYDGYAPGGGDTLLGFHHHMRTLDGARIANHVSIAKFGLPVASSDVVFRPR